MAWFDAFAKDYDEWYESKLGSFVDVVEKNLVEELAQPKPNEKVLDMGSGTGTYSLWLARLGLDVTAFDQSIEMLKVAHSKAQRQGGKPIQFVQGNAEKIPFEENTFDLVVSVTAVEFMDEPVNALQEAVRVLKPGGRLVIGLLTKHSPWGELYTEKAKVDPNNLFAKAHLYTEEEVSQLLPMPFQMKKGLYLPPVIDFDNEQAVKTEKEKQKNQEQGAGFFAVRWVKEV
ncbi:class I SAM-dependent methyltransferase [Tepidibacillus marianensis]|uniref:class I SAM-dependent methyltransferase n=1 Tax=Tepidibacillus marianensis TaxID=3131995 RepID=UPI0030D00064